MRILKRVYCVIQTNNKDNNILTGLPCANKKAALRVMNEHFQKTKEDIIKSGRNIKTCRSDVNGYCIITEDRTEYRCVIQLVNLRDTLYT